MGFRRSNRIKYRLLAERPGVSGVDLSLGDLPGDLEFVRADWVSAWVDRQHKVLSDWQGVTATRAITVEGRLIWMVKHPEYRREYHARAATSAAAFNEARMAWRRRAEMRKHKAEVRRITHEMRFLKVRHDVTVDDAYASPLCDEGVDGFLHSLGLGRYRCFPGWLIAWLAVFDRQVGFVLYEARKRHEAKRTVVPLAPGTSCSEGGGQC